MPKARVYPSKSIESKASGETFPHKVIKNSRLGETFMTPKLKIKKVKGIEYYVARGYVGGKRSGVAGCPGTIRFPDGDRLAD